MIPYLIEVHFLPKFKFKSVLRSVIFWQSGLQSDMVSMLLTFLQLSHENHENLCILVKPMCYFLKRPTAVLLETRTHVPAIIVIRLFVDKLVPSIMSFSHIAWEFFKNSNRNSRRIQVGKIPEI